MGAVQWWDHSRVIRTWPAVCSAATHSQFDEEVRLYSWMGELNRSTSVRKQLNLTQPVRASAFQQAFHVPVNIHHRANVGFSAAGLGESWQNCRHLTNNANFLPMIYF